MYFVSLILGLAIGIIAWSTASHFLASLMVHAEQRHPRLAGSKGMRIGEAVACAGLVLASLALALWLARLLSS